MASRFPSLRSTPFNGLQEKSFDRNIRIAHATRLPYVTCMATNAILSEEAMKRTPQPIKARRWQAVLNRDASLDGTLVLGCSNTGNFCRPSCPPKRPRRENVNFFDDSLEAEETGYRACLR